MSKTYCMSAASTFVMRASVSGLIDLERYSLAKSGDNDPII
jgi:hypothetical protein